MSHYREFLELWLKSLNIKANKVLDLGGASNPVISRLGSFESTEYVVFDLGVEDAKVEYIKFDINKSIKQLIGYNKKDFIFDVIFCLEVFEYVWHPVEAFRNIFRLLSEEGTAYISFPAIYPVHNPEELDYLRYTKRAIEKYASLFNFKIIDITPRIATSGGRSLSEFYSMEGMHPVKNSVLPFHIGYLVTLKKMKGGVNKKYEV